MRISSPRQPGRFPLPLCLAGMVLLAAMSLPRSVSSRALAAPPASSSPAKPATSAQAAESAAAKLSRIQQAAGDGKTALQTEFSEEEVNSYFIYEMPSRYPAGVSDVQVQFLPGRILGTSVVDFDEAKTAYGTPGAVADLLFRGTHTLETEGGFSAIDGVGHFDLESVALDGVALPQTIVDLFIETFLKPRFPRLALDRPFFLPASIDKVQVLRERIVVEVNPRASR